MSVRWIGNSTSRLHAVVVGRPGRYHARSDDVGDVSVAKCAIESVSDIVMSCTRCRWSLGGLARGETRNWCMFGFFVLNFPFTPFGSHYIPAPAPCVVTNSKTVSSFPVRTSSVRLSRLDDVSWRDAI